MKLFLFAILFTVIAIASCKQKENPKIFINEELRNYYNYQPGSYWIYYDSVSGATDSFYVEYNAEGINPSVGVDYITRSIQLRSNNSKHSHPLSIKLEANGIFLNFDNVITGGVYTSEIPYTTNITSIKIANNDFTNVKAVLSYDSFFLEDIIYLQRDAGVIQIKGVSTNTNYNLLRWKIVTK